MFPRTDRFADKSTGGSDLLQKWGCHWELNRRHSSLAASCLRETDSSTRIMAGWPLFVYPDFQATQIAATDRRLHPLRTSGSRRSANKSRDRRRSVCRSVVLKIDAPLAFEPLRKLIRLSAGGTSPRAPALIRRCSGSLNTTAPSTRRSKIETDQL